MGKVALHYGLKDGKIFYSVEFNSKTVIRNGSLGLSIKGMDLTEFKHFSSKEVTIKESWKTVWGQQDSIDNFFTESNAFFRSKGGKTLKISFRVYDDGFAFRYHIPKQRGSSELRLTEEKSVFELTELEKCWWAWADYNTLEKQYYCTTPDSAVHVACPFTLMRNDGIFMSIHEAAIEDYSTMTLKKIGKDCFNVNLVPWNDGDLVKAKNSLTSPWRAFLFGESPGDLLINNLILNLNTPCTLKDDTWIQPMTYCGVWWEMHLGTSTWAAGERHGATTENAKRYIDFAAHAGIKGVLLEGWNTGWENWGKKGAFDFVTSYPDLDLKEVVLYARSKGIEIIGHHETGGDAETYELRVEEAFNFYRELGIRVVKTGYAGPVSPVGEQHHGQCMVRHYNKIMKLAAKYQLMLDVHEPIILSGLSRTYPNLMTAEGVRGMEWNAWSEGNLPEHTCTLPFTRGIAGPMDYTPGIVDIDLSKHRVERTKWNALHTGKTAVHATVANQLALLIVLYSPLQMLADLPENYVDHPFLQLIHNLPATWDETRILGSAIGEYVYLARRSGNTWYVAGITNETKRAFVSDLPFLDEGVTYKGISIIDAPNAHFEINPEAIEYREVVFQKGDRVNYGLSEGGGFILRLVPEK